MQGRANDVNVLSFSSVPRVTGRSPRHVDGVTRPKSLFPFFLRRKKYMMGVDGACGGKVPLDGSLQAYGFFPR